MPFQIAEVQEADLPELATLSNKVWGNNPWSLLCHMLPVRDAAKMYSWRLKRLTQGFREDFVKHFKIVDTSKQIIVSYAAWEVPHPTSKTEEVSQDGSSDSNVPDTSFPEGSNVLMIKDFFDERDRVKARHSDVTQDYCKGITLILSLLPSNPSHSVLRVLFTHPEYQGQGLASMLLRRGLEEIDARSQRCYLEATPAGLPIYRKLGWTVVDEIKTDLGKYGVANPSVEHTACMMREAVDSQR
ncbi:MAG: hypothetical protein Q9225_000461 [Loekoesia sp. 1 TL-2023]